MKQPGCAVGGDHSLQVIGTREIETNEFTGNMTISRCRKCSGKFAKHPIRGWVPLPRGVVKVARKKVKK